MVLDGHYKCEYRRIVEQSTKCFNISNIDFGDYKYCDPNIIHIDLHVEEFELNFTHYNNKSTDLILERVGLVRLIIESRLCKSKISLINCIDGSNRKREFEINNDEMLYIIVSRSPSGQLLVFQQ